MYTPVGRFWLVNTCPYGCHPSVLSHHALETVECEESYCIEGGDHIWSSGCGKFCLPWVILRREGRHDHIWISIFFLVTSVPGEGGVMPLYSIWAGSTLLWVPPPPRVFGVTKNDHSLLLITVRYLKLKCDLYYINLNVIDKRHSIYIQIYLETLSICTDELLRHNWSRKSMAR